ncbi:TetR/AcrR family transcriptional regulator [Metabacillus sp. GX 13764]|uniref:TetR/AcrR family transcriptional regulator n=1 Tax=Metabacillus kandeliae TaxID=2900151 RepID=UPI001E4D9779|nr:TetR/AcrR family transcriptional regulator [Metabacillus kandeliae]MCD7034777.1 TetR/AcrR family transcriptional regulator [Metabacillus kandeliae]
MRKIGPEERGEMRRAFAKKIMNVMRTAGFGSLKIQDLAQAMDVSKATLYNYFSSKEDIITEVGKVYLDYLQEFDEKMKDTASSYQERFLKVFEQQALSSIYTSGVFLNDLRAHCPYFYEKMSEANKQRIIQLKWFYEEGMKEGVFHSLNADILIMQDQAAFQRIFDPGFLIESGLTYKQALADLLKIKSIQLLKNAGDLDQKRAEGMMNHVLYKLSSSSM